MHLVTKDVFSKRSSVVRCVIGCMNGSTLSLAIAREPGRIGWVTGRTYTMGATPVYGWQASHDALGRPVSTADSESAARSWTYNARSEMTGCTGEDLSGTEQGAGNAPVAKRSGRLSEANPKGRKGPRVGGLLAVSCEGRFYVPIYGGNGNIMGYVDESGAFAAKFVYDPYGDVISIEGGPSAPMPSPDGSPVPIPVGLRGEDFSFGFSTKYHDREVSLIAYQLRSYSPRLGRWLNRDPIEEASGVNLYGFCLDNVFLYYDSKGESFEDFSNFCVGIGDSLTFGITRLMRRGVNRMTDGTWDDFVETESSAYRTGEITEVTVEIVITCGGAVLRHIAKKTSRKVVEGGARAAYRRAHGLVGKGGEVHHINPIKGHPYGKSARYPLPFQWAARWDRNMTWYATKAEHRAAHARMMFLETIDGYRETTILVRQTGNEIINYLSASPDARCFDSLEIRTTILPLEHDLTGIHFNAVPASVTIQINQKGERLCPH